MPIKRRRSSAELNLERVFLRVTFGVSLILLVAGALIVGMVWWEQKTLGMKRLLPRFYVTKIPPRWSGVPPILDRERLAMKRCRPRVVHNRSRPRATRARPVLVDQGPSLALNSRHGAKVQ
jgi:hypothetical protein